MPGGRPKGSKNKGVLDGRIAARAHAEKAMKTLVSLLTSPKHEVRRVAASDILDRAFGKPGQSVIVAGDEEGGPIKHEHKVNHELERFASILSGLAARSAQDETPSEPESGSDPED